MNGNCKTSTLIVKNNPETKAGPKSGLYTYICTFNVQQKGKISPGNVYNLMENTLYILHHHFGIFNLEQFFYFLPDFQPVGFKGQAEVCRPNPCLIYTYMYYYFTHTGRCCSHYLQYIFS